jgi:peptidoglycan-associated lipoprotein
MKPTRLLLLVLLFPCLLLAGNGLNEADRAYDSQQYFLASQLYRQALSKKLNKTEKARACYQVAECERMTNNYSAALAYYNKAISSGIADATVYLHLAQMQQASGQYQSAIESYRKYAAQVPSDPAGKEGIDACQLAIDWLNSPTCYVVNNEAQINTKYNDFCPSWLDRKHTSLAFTSKRPGQTGTNVDPVSGTLYSDIFEAKLGQNGKWSTPAAVQGEVNRPAANDGSACLTKNGTHIYFTRCDQKKKQFITCKIYYAEKKGNTWGTPVLVDFGLDATTLDSFNFRHPAVSMNEEVMVFSSDMSGSTGGEHSDLWISTFDKKTKKWSRPVNMGTSINTSGREGFPYISDDGSLFYASDGLPGMGGLDIFRASKLAGNEWKWAKPENMRSPINSPADDFGIIFDGKKNKGYFTSNREGTKGADDIWSFAKNEIYINGVVMDCDNRVPVKNAKVKMACADGTYQETLTNDKGEYQFRLAEEQSYTLDVESTPQTVSLKASGYFSLDEKDRGKITTIGRSACDNLAMNFCLKSPPPKGVECRFPAVLYGLDSAFLRPESKDSLNYLYNLLVKNPGLVIELDAHTDCRGSADHNRDLSQRRAQACVDYLVSKGISPDRLVAKGWGEDHPLHLPNGTVLTEKYINSQPAKDREKLHSLNRRTVFQVLRTDYTDPQAPQKPAEEVKIQQGFFDDSGDQEPAEESGEEPPKQPGS